ncbi:MAG TPA: quinone oxidoreductase [Terriglobia bacterium]|nr:quinone oxidoreductase [Terriglobia bacterium]
MATVIRMKAPGSSVELEPAEVEIGAPGAGEIRLRQDTAGINFIDIYHRQGLYPLPLPAVLGVEGVGHITACGAGVSDLQIGDRVVYGGAVGGYASERLLPAWRAVKLPAAISDEAAAGGFLKALTVQMLMRRVYHVRPGDWILVHGAAGGVGSLLCQWAKRDGATVIGTVGSDVKAEMAREQGADHVIVGRNADFAAEVARITDGRLVHAAYNGIGGTTLQKTFACVRPFGTVVSIGQAAGPIPKIDIAELGPKRSLILARPSVMGYSSDPETYRAAAAETIAALASGITPRIGKIYPLAAAAQAQDDLEHGRSQGSLILRI